MSVRFCPKQYSLLHTWAIRYSLLLLGYKPVQHVTVLNAVGNCNTVGSVIILYYNIMGPQSYSLLHTQAIRYSLLLLGYKPVQRVTVLNTVGNCNTVGSVILYYNIMGPQSYSLLHTQAIRYSLLLLGYKPVQHVTVLNAVGNCNTVGCVIM